MKTKLATSGLMLSAAILVACKPRSFNSSELNPSEAEIQSISSNSADIHKANRFHLITPTGAKIFAAMKAWETGQLTKPEYYAQPAMCATNASRVLEMAGVTGYSSPLLMDMVNAVRKRGGIVMSLPKNPVAMAEKLKTVFGGRIPVGSFVSGCLRQDCSGQAGDGHIALVGDIDSAGFIKIYHNNWYRPDNERDGKWRDYMIPLDWYNKGYRRKWMPTPWVYLKRDNAGLPNNIQVRLPAIDDLDPTNYFVTLSIPPELVKEVVSNKGVITDGKGEVKPYLNSVPAAPSEPVSLSDCGKIKVLDKDDPKGVNLRSSPQGSPLCLLPNGTDAQRLGYEGQWMRVRTSCGGKEQEGYVFSFLTVSACQSER